ncbi:MAG: N-acetylmuramoyl-L-alanine amidase [Candidatus Sulfotelmatobacter sp.]|jgi:N-acetylmuramoyl-L-alanine amidase
MRLSPRGLRWVVLLLFVALPGLTAHARVHHTEAWARDHFASAERMREALNGRPPADRTRHDYQRVINNYRNVYFGAPTSTKADPSVVAVAETLVEMGRHFDDDKILDEAISQYKFLRREYPGSKYRCDALFTIGEIYKDDLNDPEQARAVFQEFLHRYPHNRLAGDAQQAVVELDREAAAEKKAGAQKQLGKETADKSKKQPSSKDADSRADTKPANTKAADTQTDDAKTGDTKADNSKTDAKSGAAGPEVSETHAGHLPRVTGIRHWSTPDYTRVAIDLESDIEFGSQRIAHPDRIFFDLRGTKLASTLVGKSFDVDDGFLKKIRVAQFQPGRTRVVLEVADLSDYEAFLLPNPYRLIVDIHGKDVHGKDNHGADSTMARARQLKEADTETADVEAPPKAGSNVAVPKDVPKDVSKNVASSELKADLKALAGKPASQSEQIHADQNVASGKQPESSKAHPSSESLKPAAADEKTAPAVVKKVIVEAGGVDSEDDDAPAVKVAKVETPAGHAHTVSSITPASRKADSAVDLDGAAEEEKAVSDSPSAGSARGKSLPRLGASRRATDLDIHEAKPTASGDRSLIRALGLKIGRIVIDPGHGGHDTGTIGPDGLQEKDLVLEVGRRLGKLLETRLGAEVVYTRKDDTFIPLETRTAIANQQRADLFISIHANSSQDSAARGVETYYLNFTSSPEALEVAARENAVSEKSIYELQDLVKKIALKEKIEESREFAGDVQESLHSSLAAKSPAIRDRGVKKAPFIVLIGANMPSILAEISFVSNPADEHRLETSEYRQRIAESLYRGIAKYVDGLSGVKVASKLDKAAGQ